MSLWTILLSIVSASLLSACQSASSNQPPTVEANAYRWQQSDDKLALLRHDTIMWQLNFDKAQDKPYFHPLRTPRGYNLTLERPDDHPWHRGLWFSWKNINGIDYWTDDPKTGIAAGRSIIDSVAIKTNEDFSAEVTIYLSYEEEGQPVLTGVRVLTIGSPVDQDQYTIRWDQTFTAQEAVELYLEKPAKHGGVGWGGYAGLSYRAADSLTDHRYLASNGWTNQEDLMGYGEQATWMDLSAKVKGTEDYVGLAMFDHPQNPRYPSPWYVWFEVDEHAFFTPSFLFDAPLPLKANERLSLQHLVLVHDGKGTAEQLEQLRKTMR